MLNVYPPPAVYNVTGGGSHCAGDTGVHIGLSWSDVGVNYMLYLGVTPVGAFSGTGGPLDFGLLTVSGPYTVVATSTATGCSSAMAGSAMVTTIASVVPSVTIGVTPNDTVCAGATTTFTPSPVNGGTSPSYVWSVNGFPVAVTPTYSFIPANGDIVSVQMASSATCPLPATAKRR